MEIAGKKLYARHYIALVAFICMIIASLFGDPATFIVVLLGYPLTLVAGVMFLRKAKDWPSRIFIIMLVIATFATANTIAIYTLN